MNIIRGTLASCLLLLSSAPGQAEAPKPKPKPIVVPFEVLKSKHIAIMVKINGKGPYRLIFDTGAPFTIVNGKVARDSGMVAKNAQAPFLSLFGSMGPVKMKTFEVGAAKVENSSAAVIDHPTVEMISKVLGPIEGLVGFPFAHYRMTLDYQAKQMTLVPTNYQPPDTMEALMATFASLTGDKPVKARVLAPAAQWGFVPHKAAGDDEAGVTIKEVLAQSAADAAGLKSGDRLLTLDGRWTDTLADTYQAAHSIKAGETVKAVIQRDGKPRTLTITPRPGL